MGTQAVTIESGGFGYMQRYLFRVLYKSEEPMTFAAICRSAAGKDFVLPSPVEQSLRRALKRSADGKPLHGAAKTSFVKKCKKDACEAKAVSSDGKPLYGAAKNSFMAKCRKAA